MLYTEKLSFLNEDEIKTFKTKQIDFVMIHPDLHTIVKVVLQTEIEKDSFFEEFEATQSNNSIKEIQSKQQEYLQKDDMTKSSLINDQLEWKWIELSILNTQTGCLD